LKTRKVLRRSSGSNFNFCPSEMLYVDLFGLVAGHAASCQVADHPLHLSGLPPDLYLLLLCNVQYLAATLREGKPSTCFVTRETGFESTPGDCFETSFSWFYFMAERSKA
jgi:hypothetical protein